MLVKPAPGLSLRDPDTMLPVPSTGLEVPDDSPLWNRMLDDKDVVRIAPKAPAKDDAK